MGRARSCSSARKVEAAVRAEYPGADDRPHRDEPRRRSAPRRLIEHAPHNAMTDADDVARFRDRCSELMAALLDELARTPGTRRTFPDIEDALGWPRRRIASVLGGVSHMRHTEFAGRRPYRFLADRESESGRWELWMDAVQAAALHRAARSLH